jgi:hypothetical protein
MLIKIEDTKKQVQTFLKPLDEKLEPLDKKLDEMESWVKNYFNIK